MSPSGQNLPVTAASPDHQEETPPAPVAGDWERALGEATSADGCLAVAFAAGEAGELGWKRTALDRAVALDRHCQPALLMLAADSWDEGDACSTFAFLEEAFRAGVLPAEAAALHEQLLARVAGDPRMAHYLRATGRVKDDEAVEPRSILLITNLFPPHELGGYGRMMWEFAHGLAARGHRLRVLTSNLAEFAKAPTADENAMESCVDRGLEMHGTWVGGRPAPVTDRAEIVRRMQANAARVKAALAETAADLVLAGNLDFLTVSILQPAFQAGVPVLHALANASPGYAATEQPADDRYWVAPCSQWNGRVFLQAGFRPARVETLYPGARTDRFFQLFLPDVRRLRLCFASLVLPYKGADTLVDALGRLHRAGIDFSAEIGGDAPDAEFLGELRERVRREGMEAKVRFTGFLDRVSLSHLFARSNVLVFPSRFQEPFGISQVEALASGLVVVSSGTGGAREIIRDGVDGLLFPAGNDAELAGRLAALARDPDLMLRLQRAGQSRAFSFSVEQAVRKIESLATAMMPAAVGR